MDESCKQYGSLSHKYFFFLVYSFMKACHLNVLKSKIFLLVEMQTMLKTGRMHTGVGEKEKHMHLVV